MSEADRSSAAVLFSCFIFFSLFQFPLSRAKKSEPLPPEKKLRNVIYISCDIAMVLCLVWVVYAEFTHMPIFWPEALALEFFAVSWLVKGRAYSTAVAAGRQSLSYARHPGQLVKEIGVLLVVSNVLSNRQIGRALKDSCCPLV
jgi:hypothetical protein